MTDCHQYINNDKHSVILDGNCIKDDCIAFSNIKDNRTSNTSIFIDNEHKNGQNSIHLWNSHKYNHVNIWRPRKKWEFCLIFSLIIILILLIIFITLWGVQLVFNQSNHSNKIIDDLNE
ncbi:hypothetical protein Smp_068700 [Schistosoma mansoni]|uniref:hypothetical protein n=1 Tax=Schistosoma mansoni TaxID=6183 RepID=UPI0001A61C63|nr:hypothetical protein Smp_068700 [Schistosoma mansoni]|eukprot:XP_018645704.1 hypothetical protein Smp_068700 [Schistosoma mansoni]